MRYDTEAIFIYSPTMVYNPETSRKEAAAQPFQSEAILANINPLDARRTAVEFGKAERDISILRIRRETIPKNVNQVRVRGLLYSIVRRETLRHDQIFYIESV